LLIFSHEKGNGFFAIYTEKGVQRCYDFYPCDVMATTGVWKKIRLVVSTSSVELYLDQKLVFTKQVSLLPVKFFSITRNGCALDFDDFKIEPSAPERTDIAELPFRFTASEKPLRGEAVATDGGELVTRDLVFATDNLFRNQSGAVMFWMTLPESPGERRLLTCNDGSGDALSITQRPWEIIAAIRRQSPLPDYQIVLGLNPWRRGDGNRAFVALVWDREKVRLYVNSMPYSTIQYDQSNIPALTNPDLEGIRQLRIAAGVTIEDLRLFQRPVSAKEIYQEYRSRMPIDLVMQTQMFRGEQPVEMTLNASPGGYFMRPMPVEMPFNKARVEISAVLTTMDGKRELLRMEPKTYDVNAPTDIVLPKVTLASGNYLLRTETKYCDRVFRRTFGIDVDSSAWPKPAVSADDFQKGREIYACDFSEPMPKMLGKYQRVTNGKSTYLEGSSANFDSFGFEVKFPESVLGQPVLIEIDWPDDKPRLAAHYIYRPSQGYCDRDRLQQGVQSGVEYPLTGGIVTTKYLFWPGFSEYLFEFRNLAAGRPAAISALRIYEIKGGVLPALKVEEPKGLPARTLGHLDEDQTFYMNLNRDYYDRVMRNRQDLPNFDAHVFRELGNYFAYTGMNSFLYNFLRYYYVFYMTDTDVPPGYPPEKAGGLDYMLDALAQNNISFICGINISSIPEVAHSPVTAPDAAKRGWLMGDRTGLVDGGMFGTRYPNFATHPEIIAFYLAHIRELAIRLGNHRNVTGFALWTVPWKDLSWGYDDYNMALFTQETGIEVPATGRYEFLTGPKRQEWLRWRADKTAKLVKMIADTIHAVNPKWELFLFPQDTSAFLEPVNRQLIDQIDIALDRKLRYYENLGMDIDQLEQLDRVYFTPQVLPSGQPEKLYQYNRLEPFNELVYYPAADRKLFRRNGKSRQLAGIYHDYFESIGIKHPSPTLLPEKYSCFFQDTDVKPWGRYFLKELTYPVAASDAQNIVFGAQPLGALGREAETREFAQAYRALPALPFTDAPGANDPVAVRYLQTANGTYFYLANMLWSPVRVTVEFDGDPAPYRDLSSGRMLESGEFELDAFALRSFLAPGKKAAVKSVRVTVPEKTTGYYHTLTDDIRTRLREVGRIRGEAAVKAENEVFLRAQNCIAAGEYAEAHRLLFSVLLQKFMKSTENIREIAQMQKMLENNCIAVNCGGDEFYSAPDGRLFFPDAEFSRQGTYGYFGQHKTCKRNIDGLKNTEVAGVFETEAWDIDGYRFRVPNGKYTVTLYLRFAYEPKFKPDIPLKFTLAAQGKTLVKDLDLYQAMQGDIKCPVILKFSGIEVTDGLLTLACIPSGDDSSIRHFNAIEVTKEQ